MMTRVKKLSLVAAVAILASPLARTADADVIVNSQETSGNATFQPGGERPGSDFSLNVEGSSNGAFASWAGARWTGINLGPNPVVLDKISVALGQWNAGFTTNGPVSLWVVPDSYAPEFQEAGALNFDSWTSIEPQSTHLLDYDFVQVSNGYQDVFTLQTGDAGFSELASSVQDGTLALAWIPENATVAATWGGIGNTSNVIGGARLLVEGVPVPEPATVALTLLGAVGSLGVVSRRRRLNPRLA